MHRTNGFLHGPTSRFGLAIAAALAGVGPACAQALLDSPQGGMNVFEAPDRGGIGGPPRGGNIHWKDLDIGFSAGLGASYNSNIYTRKENVEGDFIISPNVNATAYWPISDQAQLSITTGVSYSAYIENPDQSRFTVTPGSQLGFGFSVKDYRFSVYNSMSYSVNPVDFAGVAGVAQYGGLQNSAGLSVSRDMNLVIPYVGYQHYNFWSTVANSSGDDRASDSIFIRAPFRAVGDGLKVGPEVGLTWTRYPDQPFRDNFGLSAGVFAQWTASEYITIVPRAGVNRYSFDNGFTPETTNPYFSIAINHQANQWLTHSLTVSDTTQQSFGQFETSSTLLQTIGVTYQASMSFLRDWPLSFNAQFEHGTNPTGLTQEEFDQWGIGVGASRSLSAKLTGSLNYQFTQQTSKQQYREYSQSVVTLSFTYQF